MGPAYCPVGPCGRERPWLTVQAARVAAGALWAGGLRGGHLADRLAGHHVGRLADRQNEGRLQNTTTFYQYV